MGLSNVENILQSIVDSEEYKQSPQSRVEELLLEVKEVIEQGGGGGTTDYNDLQNKPTIDGNTVQGNMTAQDLGLTPTPTYDPNDKSLSLG